MINMNIGGHNVIPLSNAVEIPKDKTDIPVYSKDLIEKIARDFPNRLPSPGDFSSNPNIVWYLLGQQSIIEWLKAKVPKE